MRPKKGESDLKEACIEAARRVIAEQGIESLSLREVARELGVSHQAPYRHYPTRDHLLAEVMRRCFMNFTEALDSHTKHDDPQENLRSLGMAYLQFALNHPLEYRLMFSTPWPEKANHPDLALEATRAFNTLREALAVLHAAMGKRTDQVDGTAMFIWSTMHGLASIAQSNTHEYLNLQPSDPDAMIQHVMQMIDYALLGYFTM